MTERDRVLRTYERMAPIYDQQLDWFDRYFVRDARARACSQAKGDVLEVGIGTGRNLAFYPPDVRLTAIDLSPAMLDRARAKAAAVGREVDLRVGDAEQLGSADGSFDTVVSTLVLCTVPHPDRAVSEMRRVLRPGGRVVTVDHVRSPSIGVRLLQHVADPLLTWLASDHLLREPVDLLRAEGLEIESLERWRLGLMEMIVASAPR